MNDIKVEFAVDKSTIDQLTEIAKAAQVLADLITAFVGEVHIECLET